MASPTRAAEILLRRYEAAECGTDGYPLAWRSPAGPYLPRIPDLVRDLADHRCVRCRHPYRTKQTDPEWSPCDEKCRHGGPVLIDGVKLPHGRDEHLFTGEVIAAFKGDGHAVSARWRVLTVHHLTGEKADCRWWNLASLCQRCHLYIQGRVRMGQVYPYEHSEWFKPFAAGYYASVYLGEDLFRWEVAERQDELLALERVA